jgi:hypothetical protein
MTYVNLVKFDTDGYPTCEKHGSMNCVNRERTIYRCPVCHIGIDVSHLVYVSRNWIGKDEIKCL